VVTLLQIAEMGLSARDRTALALFLDDAADGAAAARCLGVSVSQSYVVVHRMRSRLESAILALAVAARCRRHCPELLAITGPAGRPFDVLTRKRVTRHVIRCGGICGDVRDRLLGPDPTSPHDSVLGVPLAELRSAVRAGSRG
jgi:hypothetical protein